MKRFLTGMFRNMKRNLLFSVINLSGLILGICLHHHHCPVDKK